MRPLWNLLFNKGWGSGQWCGANAVEKVIQAADPAAVLALGDKQYDDGRLKASSSRTRGTGQELDRTNAVPPTTSIT